MDNSELIYGDTAFINAKARLSMPQSCNMGICAKCKFWKIIEYLRGKCSKHGYNISCSHLGCSDYLEK